MSRIIHTQNSPATTKYGPTFPGDIVPMLRQIMETESDDWELKLPSGTSFLYPEVACETQVWLCNNDAGRVKVPLLLVGRKNIVVDGQGAKLMVRGTPLAGRGRIGILDTPILPVVLQDCSDVTLKNFSIDWQTPFAGQGIIVESAETSCVVRMDTAHRWWVWNGHMYIEGEGWTWPVQRLLAAEPDTGAIFAGDNFGMGYEYAWNFQKVDDAHVRITGHDAGLPAVGKMVFFWLTNFDTGARRSPAIFLNRCTRVRIENITLHHAMGMGLLAQDCQDILVDRMIVEPSGNRRFSLNADATHFVGCRGKLTLQNCRFQNQFDDAVNIHSLYTQVVRKIDARTLRLRTGHPQHQGVHIFRPGDLIEWLDGRCLRKKGAARVVMAESLNSETVNLTVDCDIPSSVEIGDRAENACAHPTVLMHNNVFRWNRARGVLVNGRSGIVIRDNHFENPGAAILVETSPTWAEAGAVDTLRIADNRFVRCAHTAMWGEAVIHAVPSVESCAGHEHGVQPLHGSLVVENNTFENSQAILLKASSWRSVAVRGSQLASVEDKLARIVTSQCESVESDLPQGQPPSK